MSQQTTGLAEYLPIVILVTVVVAVGLLLCWWLRPDPKVALIWGVAILGGSAVPAALMLKWNRQAEFQASLQRDGVLGTATMLTAQSTNVRIDRKPQVRLILRIELPGQAPYEHETLQLVPFGQSASPGRRLPIRVDPQDRNRLLLDWETAAPSDTGPAQSDTATLADRLSSLDEARKKGLITDLEFQEQRQRLLSEH